MRNPGDLRNALKAAGYPVIECARYDLTKARLTFDPSATEQQKAAAQAIADAYDWYAPTPEQVAEKTERDNAKTVLDTLANLSATEFRALTQNQKDTVLYHIMKREIRRLK